MCFLAEPSWIGRKGGLFLLWHSAGVVYEVFTKLSLGGH